MMTTGDGPGPNSHDCCHHFSSAALPPAAATIGLSEASVEPTPLPHFSSFIADQPQPPLLAHLG